ncbi:CYP2K [Mytilus edulis]|uniref:CYP2K n=1 Tax=Mytilus edulis TaxID=6550 RepID=A0A8S3TJV4_MYTED|nr:CYP2K [Mytilus edulis]
MCNVTIVLMTTSDQRPKDEDVNIFRQCIIRKIRYMYILKCKQSNLFYVGIAAPSGALWKAQRTFTINALRHFGFGKRNMESKILEEVEFFMEVLESKKGRPVNIETSVREAVSNIICSIVFGKRFNYDDKIFQKLIKDLEELLSNPYLPMVNWIPYLHYVSYISDVLGTQKCEVIHDGTLGF